MAPSAGVLLTGLLLLWGGEWLDTAPVLQNLCRISGGIGCGIGLAQVWFCPGRNRRDTALCLAAMASLVWYWWVWLIVLPAAWAAHRAPRGRWRQMRLWMIFGAPVIFAAGIWAAVPGLLDGTLQYGWMALTGAGIFTGSLLMAGKILRRRMVLWIVAGSFAAGMLLLWAAQFVWHRGAGYYWYGLPGLLVLVSMIFRRRDRMFRRYGWWMMMLPAAAVLCGIVPDLRRFGSYGKSQAFLEAARQDAGRVIPPVRQWYGTYGQWPSEQDLRKILPASVPAASFVSEGYFYLEVRAELHRPLVFYRFAPDGQEEGLLVWSKRFPAQELRVPVNFSYPDRDFRKKQ